MNLEPIFTFIKKEGFAAVLALLLFAAWMGWLPSKLLDRVEALDRSMHEQTQIQSAMCERLSILAVQPPIGCRPGGGPSGTQR